MRFNFPKANAIVLTFIASATAFATAPFNSYSVRIPDLDLSSHPIVLSMNEEGIRIPPGKESRNILSRALTFFTPGSGRAENYAQSEAVLSCEWNLAETSDKVRNLSKERYPTVKVTGMSFPVVDSTAVVSRTDWRGNPYPKTINTKDMKIELTTDLSLAPKILCTVSVEGEHEFHTEEDAVKNVEHKGMWVRPSDLTEFFKNNGWSAQIDESGAIQEL